MVCGLLMKWIDVTHIPGVVPGDEALLFAGNDLPVEEVTGHMGTINYEIVCMVGKRVPRVYVGE
jgi:alanine racemase